MSIVDIAHAVGEEPMEPIARRDFEDRLELCQMGLIMQLEHLRSLEWIAVYNKSYNLANKVAETRKALDQLIAGGEWLDAKSSN